jgi:hypothetical protein
MRSITKFSADGSTSAQIDAVQVFVEALEAHGAVFRVTPDDDFRADLDGLGPPPPYSDAISAAILEFADQIKAFLAVRSAEGIRH